MEKSHSQSLEIRFSLLVFVEVDHFLAFQPQRLQSQNFEAALIDAVEDSSNVLYCIGLHQSQRPACRTHIIRQDCCLEMAYYLRNRLPVGGGCVYVLQLFFLFFSNHQNYETTVLGNG